MRMRLEMVSSSRMNVKRSSTRARGDYDDPPQLVSMVPAAEMDEGQRLAALKWLFMAQEQNLVGRHPRFKELLAKRGPRKDEGALRAAVPRFSVPDLLDLQVLAKLAWFDLEWQAKEPAGPTPR